MLHMLLFPLFHEYTTNVSDWSSSGYFTIRETSQLSLKEIPYLSISSWPSFEIWFGVFNCLNHDRVNSRMITTANDIQEQLGLAQALWSQQNPDNEINLPEY